MPPLYPFTAIVGQERMLRALVLNAVDPRIGGVLIRGERGTAKSTAARALAALLPSIQVVEGCRFNCDPKKTAAWCTECLERAAQGEVLNIKTHHTPFINLPVSATEDRVVGTLDIEKAIQKGIRAFEPGVLASANRGLLYIDEVNLLDDHVVDVLLDTAAMGTNIIEREGISFSHPSRFILVGTMNPEEGDLRPQLLDRFALSVEIHGIHIARERVMIVERNLAFEADSTQFANEWRINEKEIASKIENAQEPIDKVTYSRNDLFSIAALTSSLNIDGHRADLVILKTARAQAAFEGRTSLSGYDIALAAELALPHRLKKGPLQQEEIGLEEMQERIEQIQKARSEGNKNQAFSESDDNASPQNGLAPAATDEKSQEQVEHPLSKRDFRTNKDLLSRNGSRLIPSGMEFNPRKIETPLDKIVRSHTGRRSVTRTKLKRGRYIQSRPANGKTNDLAFDATFRSASLYQRERSEIKARNKVAFVIRSSDYMKKIRVHKASNLIIFLVDASESMAVEERMAAAKGAIISLLTDAYQRRDRVGLIVFQRDQATLVLPPTKSVFLAKEALEDIPMGGKTPLSAGMLMAYEVICREKKTHPDIKPLLIFVTDAAGNVPIGKGSTRKEAYDIAEMMVKENIHSVVINIENPMFAQGLPQELADHLKGPCYTITDIKAESLVNTVKKEISLVNLRSSLDFSKFF